MWPWIILNGSFNESKAFGFNETFESDTFPDHAKTFKKLNNKDIMIVTLWFEGKPYLQLAGRQIIDERLQEPFDDRGYYSRENHIFKVCSGELSAKNAVKSKRYGRTEWVYTIGINLTTDRFVNNDLSKVDH